MSQKIGLFYGSNTGKTEEVAYMIKSEFDKTSPGLVEVHNIGGATPDKVLGYGLLIFGIPTWNTGELQDDWDVFFPNIKKMNFSGKKVAVFGLGDQNGYGFNFLDGAGMLADEVMMAGGELYGVWAINSKYQFNESKAQHEDHFLSLGIDQDGQQEMTSNRIVDWVKQVRKEFGV
jgi:flavodoxin I